MELPHLGKHCSDSFCKQLDFLPIKCDACGLIFCKDHYSYAAHSCPHPRDHQVPVCPVCEKPVPLAPGGSPDDAVSRHMDAGCRPRPRIYTNQCSKKGCSKRELIPVQCQKCKKNYCLPHRLEKDHDCSTQVNKSPKPTASGSSSSSSKDNERRRAEEDRRRLEEDDRQLALAIQRSLEEQPNRPVESPTQKSCRVA